MKMFAYMIPAVFCGIISFLALLENVKGGVKMWQALFYASLPGTFVIVGGLLYQLGRENARLRRRVAKLEQKGERPKPGDVNAQAAAAHEDDKC